MVKRTAHHWLRRIIAFIFFILALFLFLYWDNHSLQVTEWNPIFTALPTGFEGFRVVIISDLHDAEFGEHNKKLFQTIENAEPEMIFLLGDLEDCIRGAVEGYAEEIADGLSLIAPTYYITGNHEWAIGDVPTLKKRLTAHGVTVLSNDYEEIERNGDSVIIAGIDDPGGYSDQKKPETLAAELYAEHGDPFWILLAHRNNLFESKYSLLGADLVCSGHAHGGLVRLPFTDGLVAADRTLFPSWTAGFYEKDGSALFVTRGLGNSGYTFRVFNRPEIAVVTLHAD